MTYLAIAISAPDTAAALAAMHQAAQVADLAELRLDLMESFDLPRLLAGRPLPVIVTCRPPREGGQWQGSEAQRLAILRQATSLGADYVDLEWDVADQAARMDRSRSRVILSHHDFDGMLLDLPALADALWAAGADVVKLVGTARRLADTASIFDLLAHASAPTIAIAMGDSGLSTRLLAFRYPHAFLSFAAPDSALGTAPGQITASTMRDCFRVRQMTGSTALVGLLGPEANTSPLLAQGNAWLAQENVDARLVPLQLGTNEEEQTALDALRSVLPLVGCLSVTAGKLAGSGRSEERPGALLVRPMRPHGRDAGLVSNERRAGAESLGSEPRQESLSFDWLVLELARYLNGSPRF